MSNWQETVMSDRTKRQFRFIPKEPSKDISRWDIEGMLLAQAKISFKAGYEEAEKELGECYAPTFKDGKKAGMKKVVEWIESHPHILHSYHIEEWQAQLEEWGL